MVYRGHDDERLDETDVRCGTPGCCVAVLGVLTTLGPLSMDLYLPAFPALQRQLGADDGAVQLTLAA